MLKTKDIGKIIEEFNEETSSETGFILKYNGEGIIYLRLKNHTKYMLDDACEATLEFVKLLIDYFKDRGIKIKPDFQNTTVYLIKE